MFILMISRGVPTRNEPQWGCFEKDQAEALVQFGHKVVVASVDCRFRLMPRKIGITQYHINGVYYYNSFFLPSAVTDIFGRKFSLTIKQKQFNKIFDKIVKEHGKPDIIYGQFFFNTYLGIPLSKEYHIPLVNIEHAARFNEEDIDSESLYQASEVYKHTAANIAVADSLRESLKRLFNVDTEVVHNVFGNEFFYIAIPRKKRPFTFVATGSLITRKGFDLLPKAFVKANLPKNQWQMNIIGEGQEHQNLQTAIDGSGLTDNIHLLGTKNKEQIAQLLNQSDVFILPSRNENFSVAVLEALACGVPVISSICGGIRECINDKNGLLFPVDDVDRLAEAIRYMFYHQSEYNHQAIANDCQARFSPQVIAQQLTDIFQQVLSARATN